MDPALYFKTFRPYIRYFDPVTYEGVDREPMRFRGETGAQSALMPTLVAFMKIRHRESILTRHLMDMRDYMPIEHRAVIAEVAAMPSTRQTRFKEPYNAILEAMAGFRRLHLGWAEEYIEKRTNDPLGTGGTPYMEWLDRLIRETLEHKL